MNPTVPILNILATLATIPTILMVNIPIWSTWPADWAEPVHCLMQVGRIVAPMHRRNTKEEVWLAVENWMRGTNYVKDGWPKMIASICNGVLNKEDHGRREFLNQVGHLYSQIDQGTWPSPQEAANAIWLACNYFYTMLPPPGPPHSGPKQPKSPRGGSSGGNELAQIGAVN